MRKYLGYLKSETLRAGWFLGGHLVQFFDFYGGRN